MRGFVRDPVCHRPKWSQIRDYMLDLGRGGSAAVWQKLPAGEGFFFAPPIPPVAQIHLNCMLVVLVVEQMGSGRVNL